MNTMFIVIGVLIFLFVLGGGLTMWWLNRSAWRYKFLLITNKGSGYKIIKAKRVVDKKNKNHRYFIFKENTSELPIKEPNASLDNVPVRVISYSPVGTYVYVKDSVIDKEAFLKHSLEPEERELALWQFNENQRKYSEVDKTQIAVFFGMITLVVILMIGIIYSVVQFTNNAKLFGELSGENTKTATALNGVANTLQRLTEIQTAVLTSDNNNTIIREIS